MTAIPSEVRVAVRMLLRRPIVAIGAVLSLALGIGANTAIFSVLHRVVINPLPYKDPSDLVIIWETSAENPERWVAPANFVDWRRETSSFASLAAFDTFRPALTRQSASGAAEPEVVRAVGASGTFFTTLGVDAVLGRTLLPEDDRPGAQPVAVLSHSLWRRAFAANAGVLDQPLSLDGRQYVVVGVMAESFESPLQTAPTDLWVSGDRGVPLTFPFGGDVTAVRDSHIIYVLGRLATGVSEAGAQREMDVLMQELARRHPDTNSGLGANVKSLHAQVVGDISQLVTLLQLAVALMLLIACANVAHLLLGQAVARHTEMATRVALGAARSRLIRQMFVETLVLAVPGGLVGLALAVVGLDMLVAAAPQGLPRVHEIAIDRSVLGFTVLVTLATAVIFGLGPAWQLSRGATAAQSPAATRITEGRTIRRWHHAIVVAELAGAYVLLIGAGLLITSFLAAQAVPLGFEPSGRVTAELNLDSERYLRITPGSNAIDPIPKLQFVERVLGRVQQTPGIRAAAAAFTAPLSGAPNRGIRVEGRPPTGPNQQDNADFQVVTPDFFRAMGATLIRGRGFSESDTADAPAVAIVNQAFADAYFGGREALGRRIAFGGNLSHEIVGIVNDMRYRSVESPADPTFYLPITQNRERWPFLSFTLWSDGEPAAALSALRSAIREADPNQAITRLRTYDDILSTALAPRRFNTTLVVVFAGTALLLAAIGTYGVMSLAISVRTRELGVRAALGASPGALMRLAFRGGVSVTATAVSLGVLTSLVAMTLLQSMLFGVTARDPVTFTAVAVALSAVALVATWVPTRRAIVADPLKALRNE
jgi:predicted permease